MLYAMLYATLYAIPCYPPKGSGLREHRPDSAIAGVDQSDFSQDTIHPTTWPSIIHLRLRESMRILLVLVHTQGAQQEGKGKAKGMAQKRSP